MIKRILVGALASDEPDPIVQLAARLAASTDAELVVLELEPLVDARRVFTPDSVNDRPSSVRRLRRDHPELRVRVNEARGHPLRAMSDLARDEQPDLIIVGQGRTGRRGALLSRRASTSLVERAPCAVLLVAA